MLGESLVHDQREGSLLQGTLYAGLSLQTLSLAVELRESHHNTVIGHGTLPLSIFPTRAQLQRSKVQLHFTSVSLRLVVHRREKKGCTKGKRNGLSVCFDGLDALTSKCAAQ